MTEDFQPRKRKAHSRLPWERVQLTPIEETDLDQFHRWQNDPHLRDITMGFRFPVPRERVREWIHGLAPGASPTRAIYAVRCDGQVVGSTQLFDIQPQHRSASLGTTIAAPKQAVAGAGHVAAALTIDFGFRGLDLRRIEAECLAINNLTINALKGLGFTHEGTRRKAFYVAGQAIDTHIFGLMRDEFQVWPPTKANRLTMTLPGEDQT